MNGMKKKFLVGLLGVVGLSSCGPMYPLGTVGWTVEGVIEVDEPTYHDFSDDKLTFKVSWDGDFDNDLLVTIITPSRDEVYENGPLQDGCYFLDTYEDSNHRITSIVECSDSRRGTYEISLENIGFDDVNAKVEVVESYYNGRSITQQISTLNRLVYEGDDVHLTYDY